MTTLILTASELEAKPFEGTVNFHKDHMLPLLRELVGFVTGVGKINSLINLQKVLEQNTIEKIVLCGIGGGNLSSDKDGNGLQIGDIVIATNTIDGDIGYFFDDGTREHLKFPVDGLIQNTSKELLIELKSKAGKTSFNEAPDKIQEINKKFGNNRTKPKVFCTPIVTGDCFYHGEKLSSWTGQLVKDKTGQNNWLTDMESHAVVSLANSRNIPVAVVKAVSNYDQPSPEERNVAPSVKGVPREIHSVHNSFKAGSLDYAANNSAKLVLTWLKEKA